MQFFGIFSLIFGVLVIIYPDIISILIGSFLIFLGTSTLLTTFIFRRPGASDASWKFGSYEITRRK